MMNKASHLPIPTDIQNLFAFTENVFFGKKNDGFDPAVLRDEVEAIPFRKNNSDDSMKNHLMTIINI